MAWYEYTTWKRQGAEITADKESCAPRRSRQGRDAKLGIPTGTNALAGALEHEPVPEQRKRLIEALLQPAPPVPMPVVACWLLLWRARRDWRER